MAAEKIILGIPQVYNVYSLQRSCGELQHWQRFKQSLTIQLYACNIFSLPFFLQVMF